MIKEVKELFKSYNAHATFFIAGSHCKNVSIEDINSLIDVGHEIANHNMFDIPYNKHSQDDFENDLIETNSILSIYSEEISKWYRPPHAKMSKHMINVLDKYDLTHVLGDVFANDTSIPDPEWIAKYILNKVKPGSIVIIHMPERGVREWNYKAMDIILEGLANRGYDILNLTELHSLSAN